ncbi:MAG TPA: NfeD family protein [Pyrinomonadaceae bacterium]|jgi:membrane protein implicated in regulation of membrane protease activity|nr:NfeD family protein [Pyrinomonadaceae bacterium]
MDNVAWILWTVLGVILIIAEVFTPGFVLLWFGVGALAAAFAGLVGLDSLPLQFLIFIFVSVALTAASRTIFINYFSREKSGMDLKSGVDALPGKIGTVVSSSQGALNEGAVKVFGSTWTAYPAEGEEPLEAGERVEVERVQGASIYVRRLDQAPDWRQQKSLSEGKEQS